MSLEYDEDDYDECLEEEDFDGLMLSDGGYESGETPVDEAVRRVLTVLPSKVRKWVIRNVLFYAQTGCNAAAPCFFLHAGFVGQRFVPSRDDLEGFFHIRLIVFHDCVAKMPSDVQDYLVAHEIAHHWLGHEGQVTSKDDAEGCERDADATARVWGFDDPRRQN